MTMSGPRLVLVGGGHANLLVLASYAKNPWPCASVTLISDAEEHAYSGMMPGYIAGQYLHDDVMLKFRPFAAAAGAKFICGRVTRLDAPARQVILEDGRVVPYDVAAVALGSSVAAQNLPGVNTVAHFVKPMHQADALVMAFDRAVQESLLAPLRVVVVGGGAAGIEIALALRARAGEMWRPAPTISLVESGPSLSGGRGRALSRQIHRALEQADIRPVLGAEVMSATADRLLLRDGRQLPCDLLVWTTGPTAPTLFETSGLPTDRGGYLMADQHLRVPGAAGLFAAGDSAALIDHPETPKAGVYAVRMGPVLSHNLNAACRGAPAKALRRYRPQTRFLALLTTGRGQAIASWGSWAVTTRGAYWLKHFIDSRFLNGLKAVYR